MENRLRIWGKSLVVLLRDDSDRSLIKIIKSPTFKVGEIKQVRHFELDKVMPRPVNKAVVRPALADDSCKTCKTPNKIDGIECPGCGFKEWFNKT